MNEFNTWLWPNKIIRKRESAKLREEHNKLVNAYNILLNQGANKVCQNTSFEEKPKYYLNTGNDMVYFERNNKFYCRTKSDKDGNAFESGMTKSRVLERIAKKTGFVEYI